MDILEGGEEGEEDGNGKGVEAGTKTYAAHRSQSGQEEVRSLMSTPGRVVIRGKQIFPVTK